MLGWSPFLRILFVYCASNRVKSRLLSLSEFFLWSSESKLVFIVPHFKVSRVYRQARLGPTLIFNDSAVTARSGTGGQKVHWH